MLGGHHLKPHFPKAVHYLSQAADANHELAQLHLGLIYLGGKKGVEKNPSKAIEYFRLAAENGSMDACYNLGLLLSRGTQDVKASPGEAIAFLLKDCRGGHPGAIAYFRSWMWNEPPR